MLTVVEVTPGGGGEVVVGELRRFSLLNYIYFLLFIFNICSLREKKQNNLTNPLSTQATPEFNELTALIQNHCEILILKGCLPGSSDPHPLTQTEAQEPYTIQVNHIFILYFKSTRQGTIYETCIQKHAIKIHKTIIPHAPEIMLSADLLTNNPVHMPKVSLREY